MKRLIVPARPNWQQAVTRQGLLFHSSGNQPYWREDAFYVFTRQQIDELEAATNEVQRLYLRAVEHVITQRRFRELGVPERAIPLILKSWDEDHPALYDRFDFRYDGVTAPKLLENNADTPTSLLEAAVIQWYAMKDRYGRRGDQFNSLHDALIAKWKELRRYLKPDAPVYFACDSDSLEDRMTILYLMDTAQQAGHEVVELGMADIGWDSDRRRFVDLGGNPIANIFKLYPWEHMFADDYAPRLEESQDAMFWMEPAWNMLLSNKALLAVLWELFPGHPNLLPAYLGDPRELTAYVKKPFYSREGQGITIVRAGSGFRTAAGEEGYVYQALAELPEFDGQHPVIGSWLVDGASCGMGIRECEGLITDNMARFVPHVMV